MILEKSRFSEYLVLLNNLAFRRWIFEPGMQFLSEAKWWGDKGVRGGRHNGLDLLFYEDDAGALRALDADTKIPSIYEGKVVAIIKDFLGDTLIFAHEIHEGDARLFTLCGHVTPIAGVVVGKHLREGAPVATLSVPKNNKVPQHIHLSMALIPAHLPMETIAWKKLEESDEIIFFDPGDVI